MVACSCEVEVQLLTDGKSGHTNLAGPVFGPENERLDPEVQHWLFMQIPNEYQTKTFA